MKKLDRKNNFQKLEESLVGRIADKASLFTPFLFLEILRRMRQKAKQMKRSQVKNRPSPQSDKEVFEKLSI